MTDVVDDRLIAAADLIAAPAAMSAVELL